MYHFSQLGLDSPQTPSIFELLLYQPFLFLLILGRPELLHVSLAQMPLRLPKCLHFRRRCAIVNWVRLTYELNEIIEAQIMPPTHLLEPPQHNKRLVGLYLLVRRFNQIRNEKF